jgi:hypothetical protein
MADEQGQEHDQQHGQQRPAQPERPQWQDPGDDDVSMRNESPENILKRWFEGMINAGRVNVG